MKGLWLHRIAVALAVATFLLVAAGATASTPESGVAASVGIIRAVALHVLFAGTILFCVRTSSKWLQPTEIVEDGGWPSLRSLALSAPGVVLIQVALGAAYRQKVLGLVPHATWAFVTAILVLAVGAFVLTNERAHQSLRRWSIVLLCATIAQVLLGVLAFVGRLGLEEGATVQGWMNGAIHAHVGTGSLVLGSTVALSAWILRDVVKADTEAGRHAASHGGQS